MYSPIMAGADDLEAAKRFSSTNLCLRPVSQPQRSQRGKRILRPTPQPSLPAVRQAIHTEPGTTTTGSLLSLPQNSLSQ